MSKAKTSSQKRARLKHLASEIGQNIHAMLVLVNEILADHEYVDEFGGEGPLLDQLESVEFAHFGGSPTLSSMLRAYRANPDIEVWKQHRFNVRAMIDLAAPDKEKSATERVNWKQKCAELELEIERLRGENEKLRALIVDMTRPTAAA